MRTTLLTVGIVFGTLQLGLAGGNSSVVNITVTSIEIEDEKIIIKGDGKLVKRVMSDAEHADASAFGQPCQLLHARLRGCVFEVIPYHKSEDLGGVPIGRVTEEMRAQSREWWMGTLARAKQIKVGDKLQIGYQRERMTITGVEVTHIVGAGSLTIERSGAEK